MTEEEEQAAAAEPNWDPVWHTHQSVTPLNSTHNWRWGKHPQYLDAVSVMSIAAEIIAVRESNCTGYASLIYGTSSLPALSRSLP